MHRSNRTRRRLVVPTLALFAFSLDASADVIRVDGDLAPGTDFADIPFAVAAAKDGDVILVSGGGPGDVYSTFGIYGKQVDVVGVPDAAGTRPLVSGWMDLRFVPAGGSVTVRGLEFRSFDPLYYSAQLVDNDGVVVLEDLVLSEDAGVHAGPLAAPPLAIFTSRKVHLVGLELRGPDATSVSNAGPALQLLDSDVALHACTLRGGDGVAGDATHAPTDGADALRISGGRTLLLGCDLTGGDGGASWFDGTTCGASGESGNAIEWIDDDRVAPVEVFGGSFHAGTAPATASCPAGTTASKLSGATSVTSAASVFVPRAEVAALANFGAPFEVRVEGPANATVLATLDLVPRYVSFPALSGVLATDPSVGIVPFGTTDVNGDLVVASTIPPTGLPSLRVVVQTATLDFVNGTVALSNPSVLTVVGP